METYKVIFVSRNDNNDETEHTMNAMAYDEKTAEEIAQAFLGTQNHLGTVVAVRIWNIKTDTLHQEFEF